MSENTSTSERKTIDEEIEELHQRKHQELKDLQSDTGEMVHIDAIWDLVDDLLYEVKDIVSDPEEAGREKSDLMRMVSNHSADTDEYEIAATMIVRPLLTIKAESAEQAVEKLMASEFDTKEMAETAKPVSGIEAVEIYKDGKRLPDPQY
ncbi:hypothetical protein CK503_15815 [Aliifodinibius salipaludis]|uniref:Uncharacterized protein n=1 Tax=Fodinibius salipaludis TaxID=2032627 RepID=A0A2A2G5N9_9BACT|nr:hypothetical protein [Aliifodinibius salipaludis]PAU92618.1 hypothetical protein CK503_15815 [Aliifodinibius salipaludis]